MIDPRPGVIVQHQLGYRYGFFWLSMAETEWAADV